MFQAHKVFCRSPWKQSNWNRINVSCGLVNKGSPIHALVHSCDCTLHRPVGLHCSSLQRIWLFTSRVAFTLYQCTHADSFLIPLRSRIYGTHSEACPVLLLPYLPPQDGIKSLFCLWTKSVQINTSDIWVYVEDCSNKLICSAKECLLQNV